MIGLVYNNKSFKILNNFGFTQSNNEVTFNDITIDFTGYTLADMPLKYQEVQIKQCDKGQDILTEGDVLFFGYVDSIKLGTMKMSNEDRELTITLLSPLKLATVRTTTINGTFTLSEAITRILEPLINDGFIISEMNIDNTQVLVNYIMQTIESAMNDLCLKKNLFWFIDEHKNIKVNSIDYLFGQNITKEITNTKKEKGLMNIEPSIEAVDYANVINIKNARLIYNSVSTYNSSTGTVNEVGGFPILNIPKTIKKGDSVTFNYPIAISKDIGKQILKEKVSDYEELVVLFELIATGLNDELLIAYNKETNSLQTTGPITYSDNEGNEGTFVLQRDSFYKNLITGFKYNGDSDLTITSIVSESALRYIKMKFMYSAEINKLKGLISNSGQIEKTVDVNQTWFTLQELTDYARSLLVQDTNEVNSIVLKYDNNPNLQIGNLVDIVLPAFYTKGYYAVKKIQYQYENELEQLWTVTLQNSSLLNNYIDMFRPTQSQETETQNESLVISELIEEKINEIHTIEQVQTNILNFVLNGIL